MSIEDGRDLTWDPQDFTCRSAQCAKTGTYGLLGKCANCGVISEGWFTNGHDAADRSNECPNCKCRRIYWNRTTPNYRPTEPS